MLGELIAISAVLTFVASNVLFRKTEHEASPTFINFFRTGLGTITFIVISIILGIFMYIFLIPLGLWILLIISFVFGQVIADTSYFSAQKELGTTITLAIAMTFPLFTFILSMIFLNEPFDLRVVFSILLIGSGVVIISRFKINADKKSKTMEETDDVSGNSSELEIKKHRPSTRAILFALLASLGWAIGIIILEFVTEEIDIIIGIQAASSILSNVIRFPFALLILSTMVFRENYLRTRGKLNYPKKKSRKTWFYLIIASLIGTSLGAYLYTEATHLVGSTFMALIASASPLFALPLTYWVNKEKISKWGFLGVILTIGGVIVILI